MVRGRTIVVANIGAQRHNFTIDGAGVSVDVEPRASTETVPLNLPSGIYAFHCRFHTAMVGRLNVVPPAAPPTTA